MRNIDTAAFCVLLLPCICNAATDPECLKHLGGAFADVECFNGLSNDIRTDNERVAKEIIATIPVGNEHRALLLGYQKVQQESKKYCRLSRNSLTEWVDEKPQQNPRYFYYDVAYYQCVYENLLHQNRFLKQILDNASRG